KETAKALYRATGYRVCGERAVRVDILERLADLIRPALAWRQTSAEKPAGTVDGRCFVVTQAMTSLTGSAGEDFASILRALGYRMERRPAPPPKPAPVVVETAAAEQTPAEPVSEAPSEAAMEAAPLIADAVPAETPVAVDSGDVADISNDIPKISEDAASAPSAALLPNIAFLPATGTDEPVSVETQPEPASSMAAEAAEAPQDQLAAEATSETVAAGDIAPADADAAALAAAEVVAAPEMV